ncbi:MULTISPECIES: CDGSH iron-sulfur domain-containing protein [Legionella]|uniref:Glutamate synthetase n=1 Tax=Legionella drozanskii LLAP-1 TaxID=1212489 RepID=A0A0W0SPN8_9GAMM|nr:MULTISPECIES: CDGSH iron-sulfur domain-containing protein [Legionella]KTC85367.1 glutamate synthetase [Legionella drozanskii LLAP-1]PJE13973.1 MAG: glutamate synthetase [Legionella sp.]
MKNKNSPSDFFPVAYDVEEGKNYYWCSCGKSRTQPLCDRSDCGSKAVAYHAELTETVFFCGCKLTKDPPLCDGSHAQLLFDYLKNKSKK